MADMTRALGIAAALALVVALLLAGCGPGDGDRRLRVLAGSELKDVEPLLGQLEHDTGVKLELEYTGTLEGAERIASGEKPAMAWYPSSRYLDLLTRGRPIASVPTMRSPVIVGVKRSVATAFGWDDGARVSWRDIAKKAKSGGFTFAMTNPEASNSGLSALVGVASAFADTGNALTTADVDKRALEGFFHGQRLRACSSGFLEDKYVDDQDKLDGIINYESVLLSLNASRRLREKLVLVYPRDGIITADYPLLLTDPAHRDEWKRVGDWLRTPAIQAKLMRATARRPVLPPALVPRDERFPDEPLAELPFPARREVVDNLLIAYHDELRPPAHAIFVLDVSRSMAQEHRLEDLKAALRDLTGTDTSAAGRFARFRRRERITLIPFRSERSAVPDPGDFLLDGDDAEFRSTLSQINGYVDRLTAGGGTAVFSATRRAYALAADDKAKHPGSETSIVVLTDGKEHGDVITLDQLLGSIPPSVRDVPAFAIKFGDADAAELDRLATGTGGTVFDATKRGLSAAFKQIRGCQ